MLYLILSAVAVVLVFGTICTCYKVGQDENICNYDYKKD